MTFEELEAIQIKEPDPSIRRAAKEHWNKIAKPIDGLGVFEELICRIAAVQGTVRPDIEKKALLIFCADNGIVKEGVSQSGSEVTGQVAALMGERKSSVGVLTKHYPLEIFAYDVGMACEETPAGVMPRKVRRATESFLDGAAMQEAECMEAIRVGMEAVSACKQNGFGLLATGEMGIGNTTTATALLCALCGLDPAACTGRGAGLSAEGLQRKINVIREGLLLHIGEDYREGIRKPREAFEALRRLGGLDLAALAGVFIGGAIHGIPVVIDGLISAAAALAAERLVRGCKDYMIASHLGREQGMTEILKTLDLQPVLCADLALGEGTGAALLLPTLDLALSLYREGTCFADTAIGQYERHPS